MDYTPLYCALALLVVAICIRLRKRSLLKNKNVVDHYNRCGWCGELEANHPNIECKEFVLNSLF